MTMSLKGAKPWTVSIVDEKYEFALAVSDGMHNKWLFIKYDCLNKWGALFSKACQPFNKSTIDADNYKELVDKLLKDNDELCEIFFPPEELMTEYGLKKLSEEYSEYCEALGDGGAYEDLVVHAIAG